MLVLGRAISALGSALTVFALDIWVYQQTGSLAVFAALAVAGTIPALLFAPFAGVLVDRFPRKRLLVMCDLLAACAVCSILLAQHSGKLVPFLIGAVNVLLSMLSTIAWPAAAASVSELTSEHDRARINGIWETLGSATMVGAPLLGAAGIAVLGLEGIVALDVASYCLAALSVLALRYPPRQPDTAEPAAAGRRFQFLHDAAFGFRWIAERRPLMMLLLFFAVINFGAAIMGVALTPYILSFGAPHMLASTIACAGAGGIAGGMLFTFTGGMKRHQDGVLLAALASGICMIGLGIARTPLVLFAFAFFEGLLGPFMNASSQTIWMNAVPGNMQGRVFAIRKMIAWGLNPVSILMSVPLAASLFGPLLSSSLGGWHFSQTWGDGQAGALGMMISVCGLLTVMFATAILVTDGLTDKTVQQPA